MHYIKNFFKILASFYLVMLFSQGCECVDKALRTKNIVPHPSEDPSKEDLQEPNGQHTDKNGQASSTKEEVKPPIQESTSASSPLYQPTEASKEQGIQAYIEMLRNKKIPDHYIQELVKVLNDGQSKLAKAFPDLSADKLQFLSDLIVRQAKDLQDAGESMIQLNNLLTLAKEKFDEKKLQQVKISELALNQFIELSEKEFQFEVEIEKKCADPKDDTSSKRIQKLCDDLRSVIDSCRQIQPLLLECSAEQKQTYQALFDSMIRLQKNHIEPIEKFKQLQLTPGSLKKLCQIFEEMRSNIGKILSRIFYSEEAKNNIDTTSKPDLQQKQEQEKETPYIPSLD